MAVSSGAWKNTDALLDEVLMAEGNEEGFVSTWVMVPVLGSILRELQSWNVFTCANVVCLVFIGLFTSGTSSPCSMQCRSVL